MLIVFVCFSCIFELYTASDNAGDYDSYGHRCCWTAAASCPYYSCRHRAKPVGLVLPCVYCSRTRCCALWFVDDDDRADSVFRLILFWMFSAIQQQTPQGNTSATGTSPLDSSGLVPLLHLPAPRQAGRACSALCVLFSYLQKQLRSDDC